VRRWKKKNSTFREREKRIPPFLTKEKKKRAVPALGLGKREGPKQRRACSERKKRKKRKVQLPVIKKGNNGMRCFNRRDEVEGETSKKEKRKLLFYIGKGGEKGRCIIVFEGRKPAKSEEKKPQPRKGRLNS